MLPVNMQVGHRWKCIYPWSIWPIQKTDPFDPLTHHPSTHCLLWFSLLYRCQCPFFPVNHRFVPREWSYQGTPMFQHIEWDGMGLVVMRPRLMAAKGQSQSSQLGADGVECRTFVPGHFAPPWKSSSRTSASVPWPNPLLTLSLITLTLALIILTLTLLTPTVTINSNHMTLNSYPNQGGCQWWGFPGADVRGWQMSGHGWRHLFIRVTSTSIQLPVLSPLYSPGSVLLPSRPHHQSSSDSPPNDAWLLIITL